MLKRRYVLALAAGGAVALRVGIGPAAAGRTRIGGTGAALGLMKRLCDVFCDANEVRAPGTPFEIVPATGSAGGIAAVIDGVLDLGVSGRPLSAQEAARGAREMFMGATPFVFATSHPNPESLTRADVIAIYAGTRRIWADGTPIKLILRPRSDGDPLILIRHIEGLEPAMEAARRRAELPVMATDQRNTQLARQLPGSFVGAALAQLLVEEGGLQIVPLDGLVPGIDHLASGAYVMAKPFYCITGPRPSSAAVDFLAFLRSDEAGRIMRSTGVLPAAH